METTATPIPFGRFPARWLLAFGGRIVQKRGPNLAYVLATGETITVASDEECRELTEHPCPAIEDQPWGERDPETLWDLARQTDQGMPLVLCDPYSMATDSEPGIPPPLHCG